MPEAIANVLMPLFPKRFGKMGSGTDRPLTLKRILRELGSDDIVKQLEQANLKRTAEAAKNARNSQRRHVAKQFEELARTISNALADFSGDPVTVAWLQEELDRARNNHAYLNAALEA